MDAFKRNTTLIQVSKGGQYTLINKEYVVSNVILSRMTQYHTIWKTKLNEVIKTYS